MTTQGPTRHRAAARSVGARTRRCGPRDGCLARDRLTRADTEDRHTSTRTAAAGPACPAIAPTPRAQAGGRRAVVWPVAVAIALFGTAVAGGLAGCATVSPSHEDVWPAAVLEGAEDPALWPVAERPGCDEWGAGRHVLGVDRAAPTEAKRVAGFQPPDLGAGPDPSRPTNVQPPAGAVVGADRRQTDAELALFCERRWLAWGDVSVPQTPLVLALHGFGDHAGSLAVLGDGLALRGLAMLAYDQAGFGLDRRRSFWPGDAALIDDATAALRRLREVWPERPIWLVGKSMGGAVAWIVTSERSPAVDGVVLIAPAVWGWSRQGFIQRHALRWLATWAPQRAFSAEWMRRIDVRPTDDRAIIAALRDDRIVLRFARLEALYGVSRLMDRAAAIAPEPGGWQTTVVVFAGGRDEVIRPRALCEWLRSRSWPDEMRGRWWPEGYHMLTRYTGRESVFDALAEVIRLSVPRQTTSDSGDDRRGAALRGEAVGPERGVREWGVSMAELAALVCAAPDPRKERLRRLAEDR